MKIAVYTARIGKTDRLREPSYVTPGVGYYCASDQPVESKVWRRIEVEPGDDSAMTARLWKLKIHEVARADFTVWQDCRFSLEIDPAIFAPLLMRHDLLVMPHPWCPSLRDEAQEIGNRGLVNADLLEEQLDTYREAGFAVDQHPHSSTGLLVRRSDRRTMRFNNRWVEEVERWGHSRDQMSFDFVAWKNGMRVGYLQGGYRANPYATWGESA
jgi:hypothetical protein